VMFCHGPGLSDCAAHESRAKEPTYDVSEDAELLVINTRKSKRMAIRTFRTSCAFRCNAMSFSGLTTGILGPMPNNHA